MTKWVDKRTESYIKNHLRRIWGWDKERRKAIDKASLGDGRRTCSVCNEANWPKETQVDHTEPVDAVSGWDGWDSFIRRLFCKAEGLRVLCKRCHETKTIGENKCRKRNPRTTK